MRKITALFILAGLSAVPAFSQEMPAALKSELEAKAAELQPSNKSAAKTWLVKQMNAWESIQNLAVAADADDIEMIKKLAEKKFPLDYVSQEVFINEQAVAAAGLPDLKSQIGKASYDAIKAKFDKEGKTDLNEFINLLNAQIAAKSQLEMLKPLPSIDESTFSITKEVLKKKYPDDFLAQLNELKKLSNAVDAAADASAKAGGTPAPAGAAPAQGAANAAASATGGAGTPQQPLTLAELNLKAREQFNSHALTVEGDSKVTGLPVVMHDRQFILIPFSAFSGGPNVSIMNNLGEQVEFDKENIFASKDYPFVIVMPKSIPSSTTNAKLATDKEYREIVGKPIFFIGYTTTNIQIFPVKLNAVSDQTLVLSSRIPNNFIEGTTLVNPEEDLTLGSMIAFKKEFPKVQWGTRNSVNFLRRTIETKNPFLTCVRVDRLERWEKLDFEKLAKQRKKARFRQQAPLGLHTAQYLHETRRHRKARNRGADGIKIQGRAQNAHGKIALRQAVQAVPSRFDNAHKVRTARRKSRRILHDIPLRPQTGRKRPQERFRLLRQRHTHEFFQPARARRYKKGAEQVASALRRIKKTRALRPGFFAFGISGRENANRKIRPCGRIRSRGKPPAPRRNE